MSTNLIDPRGDGVAEPVRNVGGRPRTPTDPAAILLREMQELVKVSAQARKILEKSLEAMQLRMEAPNTTIDQMIAIGGVLPNIMNALSKSLNDIAKLLLPKTDASREQDDETTGDDLLRQITGGK
jgi:hypothetical protein